MSRHSHYLFEAVPLLLQCKVNLKLAISRIHFSPGRYESLFRLRKSLLATEKLLFTHVFKILRESSPGQSEFARKSSSSYSDGDVLRALDYLKHITTREANNSSSDAHQRGGHELLNPQDATIYTTSRGQGAESQLLFRLIVIFQLLLVRIDDAHFVITGERIEEDSNGKSDAIPLATSNFSIGRTSMIGVCCLGAAGIAAGFLRREQMGNTQTRWPPSSNWTARQVIGISAKLGSSVLGFVLFKGFLNVCWMTDKIIRSNIELSEWNHQWELIQASDDFRQPLSQSVGLQTKESPSPSNPSSITLDEKSKTLIEYAQKHGRKSHFWRSTGEIRFLMVKRFMDIYYASVGVGVHCTKDNSFFLPLVAGAAASFYTMTGASTPTVVKDESSRDLIQHAW